MSLPRPLLELARGEVIESTHYGHIAVVDSQGRLLASYGDPQTVAFLRSSAKPFQAIPFVERGGAEHFGFTQRELALACASHEGSAAHIETVQSMQQKAGLSEDMLQCGVHMPGDPEMFRAFVTAGRPPTPNFNNCSGKHTAMLAHAKMRGLPLDTYLDRSHPIQQDILAAFAGMCGMDPGDVSVGIDGCSAPNFAVPLYNAALAMARLCDPAGLDEPRRAACLKITSAMAAHPEMISASGEFDCELIRASGGGLFTKRGAEGFQILGIGPGVLAAGSPGVGVAFKVSDGDASRMSMQLEFTSRVRPAVALEVLQQLGALSPEQQKAMARYGPTRELRNHRGIVTGSSRPAFQLQRHG